MKVALFHGNLPHPGRKPGGVEMVVHRLANALVELQALEVTVFSCDSKPHGALYRHVELFGGRLQRGGPWRKRLTRWTVVSAGLNFVDFSEFDILHLHGDDWFFINRSLATVRTMHGSALQEARHASGMLRKLSQYAVYPLEHISSRLATMSVGVGRETQDIYNLQARVDNGVDVEEFKPQAKSSFPLIVFIGSWSGRKRGQFVFETFVRDILPLFPNAQLYMASDIAPKHPNVINGGIPTDSELANWLGKAWVFAYPSVYEGFGVPYIEALASGTAVVTTKNSGADYVLCGGKYGVMTNDTEFGPAIIELLTNAPRRQDLERAGIEYAKRFSWEHVAAQHLKLYRYALAKRQNTTEQGDPLTEVGW